jgi:hypothetical protein
MSKRKTTFELAMNDAYPSHRGIVNIIGQAPDEKPYLSFTVQERGNQASHMWMKDKDLELFAINILRALKSKHLNP